MIKCGVFFSTLRSVNHRNMGVRRVCVADQHYSNLYYAVRFWLLFFLSVPTIAIN